MATYIFYCIIAVYILSSLIQKKAEGRKEIGERVHKTITLWCKLWPRKQRLYERFNIHVVLNSAIFYNFYMILFYMYMLDTFYLSSVFQSITLINYASSYRIM